MRPRRAILLLAALALGALVVAGTADAQDGTTPPIAKFTLSPQRPDPGQTVTASALPVSKAFPPCEPIQNYAWDWDADGEFEKNGSGTQGGFVSSHVFNDSGVFPVALRVTDRCGQQALAVVNVTVGATGPTGSLDWTPVLENQDNFLAAAWLVLRVSIIAILVGLPLGVIVGLARLSRFAPLRVVATAYVEILRGTPLLVQILFVWLALPEISPLLRFEPITAGTIALIVNTSAYQGEIIRAGIQAIASGQTEAALGMGLSRWQTMRHVVLPQALRLVIPPLTNEFIILVKDTSLLSVIGVIELMLTARIIGARTYSMLEPLMAVAAIYFVLTYSLSLLLQYLERRLRIPGLGMPAGGQH